MLVKQNVSFSFMRQISAVNFTNTLQAAFLPISFWQNNTNWKNRKASNNTYLSEKAARKLLVKLIMALNLNQAPVRRQFITRHAFSKKVIDVRQQI